MHNIYIWYKLAENEKMFDVCIQYCELAFRKYRRSYGNGGVQCTKQWMTDLLHTDGTNGVFCESNVLWFDFGVIPNGSIPRSPIWPQPSGAITCNLQKQQKKTLYALNVFPLHVRASNAYKFQQITREDNIFFMRCLRLSDQFFHFSSWNPFYCYCLHITTEYTYIDVYICSAYIMSTIVRCVWQYHVCVCILLYISMCMRQKR